MKISGITDYSTLFSSLNGSSSQTSNVFSMSSLLSEYNSIRNGSYAKLAKQYYAKTGSSDSTDAKTNSEAIKTTFKDTYDTKSGLTVAENKELISDVSTFRKSVSSIVNDDALADKKSEDVVSKVKSFVDGYNSVVENGGDSENSTILRNTLNMTTLTDRYSKQLENIGITINSDNTLSVDEDKLKAADVSSVKSLFSPTSSYSRQLDTMATNIASQAASDVYSQGGYTSSGQYKQTLESIYTTTI